MTINNYFREYFRGEIKRYFLNGEYVWHRMPSCHIQFTKLQGIFKELILLTEIKVSFSKMHLIAVNACVNGKKLSFKSDGCFKSG